MFSLKAVLLSVVGAILWFVPIPDGVSLVGWHVLVVFIVSVAGIVLNVMQIEVIALVAMAVLIATHSITTRQALRGFGSDVLWLVVMAFFIARGVMKTGIGNRMAYFFIYKLGGTSLGLSYGVIFVEFILAPLIPSSGARGGGIVYPALQSVISKYSEVNEAETDDGVSITAKKKQSNAFAAFLIQSAFHANVIVGAMFMTAMAGNPIVIKLAAEHGIHIRWIDWFKIASIPGIASLLLLPLVLAAIFRCPFRQSDCITSAARDALKKMGAFKGSEIIMLGIFVMLISLWVFEGVFGIAPTGVAIIGLVLLLLFRIITLDDMLKEKGAWKILLWFGIFITLAQILSETGIVVWISNACNNMILGSGYSRGVIFVLLCAALFLSHYVFASMSMHLTVMYSTFLLMFLTFDVIDQMLAALVVAFLSILSGGLTHYGSAVTPIYYGAGYMTIGQWWRVCLIVCSANIVVWSTFGIVWWEKLGLLHIFSS